MGGQRPAFAERFWNKKNFFCSSLFRYYIKQIDSMLPCVCSEREWLQKTSKCGKHISDTLGYRLVCHFVILTTFWRHLWSITEPTHGNIESICLVVAYCLQKENIQLLFKQWNTMCASPVSMISSHVKITCYFTLENNMLFSQVLRLPLLQLHSRCVAVWWKHSSEIYGYLRKSSEIFGKCS